MLLSCGKAGTCQGPARNPVPHSTTRTHPGHAPAPQPHNSGPGRSTPDTCSAHPELPAQLQLEQQPQPGPVQLPQQSQPDSRTSRASHSVRTMRTSHVAERFQPRDGVPPTRAAIPPAGGRFPGATPAAHWPQPLPVHAIVPRYPAPHNALLQLLTTGPATAGPPAPVKTESRPARLIATPRRTGGRHCATLT